MLRAKLIKKANNLEKVKRVIEIAKFDTLKKIAQSQKIKKHHYEMAEISQKAINYAKSLNKASNKLRDKIYKDNDRTLWIYITIPSSMIKISYEKFENMIIKDFDKKKDSIIIIGDPAYKFAAKNDLRILSKYDDLMNTSDSVSAVVNSAIINYDYGSVKIVANASKIKIEPWQIFPFKEIKFKKSIWSKYSYHYSLSGIMENISSCYASNIIHGIYQETYRLFYAEKLSRHESSLNTIDHKYNELKMLINKEKRKAETEDLIHTTKISKRR